MESAKQQPEWSKKDKLSLLNIQKVLSVIGFFLSIVECTNLFLTYKKEANQWFLNFGIVTVFVILLNILTLLWALKQTDRVNREDEAESSTDTPFTQVVLFLSLYINTLFAVSYLLYSFYKTDLTNSYQANHDSKDIQAMAVFLTEKQGWIDFISISNLIVGVFTVFCSYSLAPSALTHRLLVYVLIIFSMNLSFSQISNKKSLEQVYTNSNQKYNDWSLQLIFGIAIANIVFLVLTYLANTRKLRIAYMILGAFFLVTVAIQIPATGRLLKDYRDLTGGFNNNCVPELGKLNVEFVESQGCPQKYLYQTRAQCPASPNGCFISPNDCPAKKNLFQVWETTLVNNPVQTNVLGCVNTQCCGVLVNSYTRTLLRQAQLSLTFLFVSFYLAVFTFQLSAMDKGDQNIHPKLFVIFSLLLLLAFVLGVVFVNINSNSYLSRATIITSDLQSGTNVIKIQQNEQLDSYLRNGCQPFKEFQLKQTAANSAIANAVDFSAVTSLGDLETLVKSDPNNNLCPTGATCDGFLVLIRTPLQSTSPVCKASIDYTVQGESDNDVRVLASSTVSTLLPVTAGSKYNYFGVVGTQARIEQIFQGDLNVCNYDPTCATVPAGSNHDDKFVVRVVKVDLSTFGFSTNKDEQTTKSSTTATVAATSTLELGNLRKKISHIRKLVSVKHSLQHKQAKPEEPEAASAKPASSASTQEAAPAKSASTASTPLPALVPANSAVLQIVIHDVADDNGLKGAQIRVYSNPTNFNDNCDSTAITVQPDYQDNTDGDGLARVELYFATATAQTYSVYASKDGYNTNCRKFSLTQAQTTQRVDLGLGKELQKGQTRVQLQWNSFAGTLSATDVQPFDLDLWATFGQYTQGGTVQQFDCHVGITDHNCGGVRYHGDSQENKNGKSSESITFETIGRFNYLVFFNRYYSKLPLTPAATNWVTDVTSFEPVLKYYSSESKLPENTVTLAQLVGTLDASLNANQKFDVLAYCIKAGGDAPTEKAEAVAVANSVWKSPLYNDYNTNQLPTSQSSRGTGPAQQTVC